MEKINFKSYHLKLKIMKINNMFLMKLEKNILLTPEEWVRQNCVQFLIHEKKYPKSLISVEKKLSINTYKTV